MAKKETTKKTTTAKVKTTKKMPKIVKIQEETVKEEIKKTILITERQLHFIEEHISYKDYKYETQDELLNAINIYKTEEDIYDLTEVSCYETMKIYNTLHEDSIIIVQKDEVHDKYGKFDSVVLGYEWGEYEFDGEEVEIHDKILVHCMYGFNNEKLKKLTGDCILSSKIVVVFIEGFSDVLQLIKEEISKEISSELIKEDNGYLIIITEDYKDRSKLANFLTEYDKKYGKKEETVIPAEVEEAIQQEIEEETQIPIAEDSVLEVYDDEFIPEETKEMIQNFAEESKRIDEVVNANMTQEQFVDTLNKELDRVKDFEKDLEEKIEKGEEKLNKEQKEVLNNLAGKQIPMSTFWNGVSEGWFNY